MKRQPCTWATLYEAIDVVEHSIRDMAEHGGRGEFDTEGREPGHMAKFECDVLREVAKELEARSVAA